MLSSCLLGPYAVLTKDTMPQTYKRKRSWSRAVFSNLQRKGLEKRFEIQKYVTKPDRKQLAAMLGLTDAQVRCSVGSNEFRCEVNLHRPTSYLWLVLHKGIKVFIVFFLAQTASKKRGLIRNDRPIFL